MHINYQCKIMLAIHNYVYSISICIYVYQVLSLVKNEIIHAK